MKQFEQIDSIIFDLDGTLWDSTATVAKAWQAAIDQLEFVEDEMSQAKVQSITGMAYDAIFEKLFPQLSDRQRTELKKVCAVEELAYLKEHGGSLYEGLENTLHYLSERYPLYIVSNCQRGYIEAFLDYYGLHDFFQDHDCFGNALKSKADNIGGIICRHNLRFPVYIGDTQGDYQASYANKIPFIYASYGFGKPEAQDARIDSITDLTNIL